MKINLIKSKEILDLEKEIGYQLIVNERFTKNKYDRFYVRFENGEISDGATLISAYGDGDNINVALKNYCEKISNRILVFNAYSDERFEIELGKLVHTKYVNENGEIIS